MELNMNKRARQMVNESFAVHQCFRTIDSQEKVFTWIESTHGHEKCSSDYLLILPDGVTIIENPSEHEVWFAPNIVQVSFSMGNFEIWTDGILGIF